MSGKTVNSAILLLILGNGMAIISDMIVKLQGADVAVFQFVAFRFAITILLLLPFFKMIDRERFWEGARWQLVRAIIGYGGICCMVVSLNSLPLATANAIYYTAPILVMILAVLIYKETLTLPSIVAVISGFGGIVAILRPIEISWQASSAFGVSLALAFGIILLRKLPKGQSTVHTLLISQILMLPIAIALAIWENAPFNVEYLYYALGSSVFILFYNASVIMAYRWVEANQVTSAEYTGMVWAIIMGWIFFAEKPDIWLLLGGSMIVLPLVWIAMHERKKKLAMKFATAVE